MSEVVTYIHSHGRIGSTEVQSSACEGGGTPRRSRRSLSLSDPAASAAAVTPLRQAEHYHTYGELELNHKTRGLHVKCWYNTTAHTQSESPASWRCQRDGGGLSKLSTDGHTKGARAETHGGSSRCAQAAQHALRAACRAFAHTTQLRHNWPKCPNVAYVRT